LQQKLYDYVFSEPARSFFSPLNGTLGALGSARGKLTLLRRFDWSLLPANATQALGLDVSSGWQDNVADFSITYNAAQNKSVRGATPACRQRG
jgi:1-phosphatidylinositol phosphodiesterase